MSRLDSSRLERAGLVKSVLALSLVLLLSLSALAVSASARASPGTSDTRKRVLAFYYPWYGIPEGPAGHWRHWNPSNSYAAPHKPLAGYYDSGSENTIRRHIKEAKFAGIDGFISSWWGRGGYTDRNFGKLLEVAENEGFYATIYYEAADTKEQIISDLTYIFKNYTDSPAFLKVNCKPVIFIYGRVTNKFGSGDWGFVFENLKERGFDGFYMGDGFDLVWGKYFDGVHTYNPVTTPLEELKNTYNNYRARAEEEGKIFAATVVPGYDDRVVRSPGHVQPRNKGVYYWRSWDVALSCNPDWILITSFNEWHEGSEIEPSENEVFPRQYLKQTRRHVDEWKGGIFQVENLMIEPGEPTTVSASLRNTGEMEGTRQVNFSVNGEIIDNRTVNLSPGENEQVSFTLSKEESRTSKVAINALTGSFTVEPQRPPWFVDPDDGVGLSDLMQVAGSFGESGAPGWIPADVNEDSEVGLSDLMTVAGHFGETR